MEPEAFSEKTHQASRLPCEEELARARVRIEEVEFELELARQSGQRLEMQRRRLEHSMVEGRAELAAVRGRLAERERYVEALHRSLGWRLLQGLRSLFGRRW